jgi:5-dehydro-2-deoxygluconokinase
MWAKQEKTVVQLFEAARRNRLEFLLEVIPSKVASVDAATTGQVIRHWYKKGIYPDWWKLEPMQTVSAWQNAIQAIEENDNNTRGIVVLGLEAPEAELKASFEVAAQFKLVKGFAVGRTIFADTAKGWFRGELTDGAATVQMAQRYKRLCDLWDAARANSKELL